MAGSSLDGMIWIESFFTESQLVDGKCPDCGRPVTPAKEEAYFFKMSKYAPRLIDYINTQRVNRAAQLLVQNNHTIAAVAEEVGILDVNYFTKIFKKTLGVTPTRYRREHKEK